MAKEEINILHLEDEAMDAYLVKKILDRALLKFQITVVCDKESFITALHSGNYDIVLADHSMPQFTAMDALRILKEANIDIPLILVTGTVSEEYSVNAMKEGAWDYILKDRLQRLPIAVVSAMDRYEATLDRKKHVKEIFARESLMKEAERLAHFGSWQADFVNGVSAWSDEMYRILCYEPTDISPAFEHFVSRVHPEDMANVRRTHDHAFGHLNNVRYECRLLCPDDTIKHIYAEIVIKRDTDHNIVALNGFIRDITESKEAKQKLSESEDKYKYLFAHSPQPAWVVDTETYMFLDVNDAAIEHYGYTYEEFINMNAADIRPKNERERFISTVQQGVGSIKPQNGMWTHIKKDGTLINVQVLSGEVVYEGRPARLILLTDITTSVLKPVSQD